MVFGSLLINSCNKTDDFTQNRNSLSKVLGSAKLSLPFGLLVVRIRHSGENC